VLWQGRTQVEELRFTDELDDYDQLWQLPSLADVTITDQRLLFVCARWEVGGGWSSWGAPVGAALLNVASRVRAATLRRGVVMVGQLRWQWPVAMQFHHGSSGSPPRRNRAQGTGLILITGAFRTAGKPALRLFGGDLSAPTSAGHVGLLVRQAIVRFRLDRAVALGLDEAATQRLDGPAGTGGRRGKGGMRSELRAAERGVTFVVSAPNGNQLLQFRVEDTPGPSGGCLVRVGMGDHLQTRTINAYGIPMDRKRIAGGLVLTTSSSAPSPRRWSNSDGSGFHRTRPASWPPPFASVPRRSGGAAPSPDAGSGRCSRTGSAPGNPGAPARPPRTDRLG
jgi:hypothetical protein